MKALVQDQVPRLCQPEVYRKEYPRLASYHEWGGKEDLGHFDGPSWEEHVRSASRYYVDQDLLS